MRVQYDLVMAGAMLTTILIIIMFSFLGRQFMEGIAATGAGLK
jgi:ABC-type glycerol-3-phosphate transport system permease component